ncbi:hypothetical protein LshimejAT787_0108040 [Lyophyllum shimeji]|uniref:Uncharacterized protein n=1 Tax=Lyophyllum shimeji TaxID=47721 RepID=A0A9P3PD82_LYOSH|nr:hypothetical protein LshimejAT787_0108040 [Lyophyllum shimeji]
MPFKTRNPYYLRISATSVLPVYLYLDERHLAWMSDTVLQQVLADLRPHILPKLKAEASIVPGSASSLKKATVDTHRGETYQFCYFFRKTEPHSVLVKVFKELCGTTSAETARNASPPVPSSSRPPRGKRKSKADVAEQPKDVAARKKRRTKGKGKARDEADKLSTSSGEDYDYDLNPAEPRRSRRPKKTPIGAYRETDGDGSPIEIPAESGGQAVDVDMAEQAVPAETPGLESSPSGNMDIDHAPDSEAAPPTSLELEIEEEEKPKPVLRLNYQGFNIYGHCLCIVVEPWPPIRAATRAPSVVSALTREPSIAPPVSAPTPGPGMREKTPLFLPDDWRERSVTPAPFRGQSIPPSTTSLLDPRFSEDSDESEDDGGMMQFSQVLNNAGDARAGAADDDEDADTGMFFGDADETREL